jgi:CRISPR-associated protein Cas1
MARWVWEAREPSRSVIQREIEAVDERINRVRQVEDCDTIRGIEGDGARRYFKCLRIHLVDASVDMPFIVRTRRPPRDEVNALLSYLYGVVLTEVIGALEAVGLDPQVGFFHGLRPGRPSLGLDLLEEFRPAFADRLAVALLTRRMVRQEHFTSTAGRACYLTDTGRRTVIEAYDRFKAGTFPHRLVDRDVPRWALPALQATLLARHLRGDLPAYAPFVMVA